MTLEADDGNLFGTQSVERSIALLIVVAKGGSTGVSLSEVVTATALKQPTVRRLLMALVRGGLLEQDEDSRRYFLGPECYVLGIIAAERYGIHRLAMDSVRRLAQKSEDSVHLIVRNGLYGVCLERHEGSFPIRSYVLAVGDRLPLPVDAGSLAIFAGLSDAEIETIIRLNGPSYVQRYPLFTPAKIRELIAETRQNGYAVNHGLVFEGSWGVGVVIRDPQGNPVAALSIAAIKNRMSSARQANLAAAMKDEAHLIETRIAEMRALSATATKPRRKSVNRKM